MEMSVNEQLRLQALYETGILDSKGEQAFQDIAVLGTALTGAPMCAITFMDLERQWCKAAVGLSLCEHSREEAFCSYVISSHQPEVVPDMRRDKRFSQHPFVTGSPFVRSYAGFPILRKGQPIGVICVMDFQPRFLNEDQCRSMQLLADLIGERLEAQVELNQLKLVADKTPGMICSVVVRNSGEAFISYASPGAMDLLGTRPEDLIGLEPKKAYEVEEEDLITLRAARLKARETGRLACDFRVKLKSGELKWIRASLQGTCIKNGVTALDGVLWDVTAEKKLEDLAQVNAKQVLETTKMRARAVMATTLAHEIKNPLAIIQALTEEIAEETDLHQIDKVRAQKNFETIFGALKRITDAINELSSFSDDRAA